MKTNENTLRIGFVTCVSMDADLRSWIKQRGVNGCVYPITNTCFYDVNQELITYHIERAILENGYCILNYGACHSCLSGLKEQYGDKLMLVESENCYQTAVGDEVYQQHIDNGRIFRNATSIKCWSSQIANAPEKLCSAPVTFIVDECDDSSAYDYLNALDLSEECVSNCSFLRPDPTFLYDKLDKAYQKVVSLHRDHSKAGAEVPFPFSFHNPHEYYYILDSQNNIIFSSQVSDSFLSKACLELVGVLQGQGETNIKLVDAQKILDKRNSYLEECALFSNRSSFCGEYELLHHNEKLWVKETLWVSYDENRNIQNVYGRIENITDIKHSQATIAENYAIECRLREQLEDENRSQRYYLKALVHEIRTPLTPLIAASDALMTCCSQDESISTLARSVREGAEMLNSRVNDLFELEKGRSGLLKLNCDEYSVDELLQEVQNQYVAIMARQNKRFEVVDTTRKAKINCDRKRIHQIFCNLINNALRYTKEGDYIEVKAECSLNNISFSVTDSGRGVAAEKVSDLFTAYRSFKSDSNLSGLGLGLPIAKMYTEQHGGCILYRPHHPQGSHFIFTIPLERN